MKHATLYRYRLPMDSGVILRDQRLTHREGLLLELQTQGRRALGEVAPLAGFSAESLNAAQEQLLLLLMRWTQGESCEQILQAASLPSVAFGLSMAFAELELAQSLPKAGNFQTAPLCSGDPDEVLIALADLFAPLAKIKVGLYEPIRDGLTVSMLLDAIPTLKLRLDANRQWSLAKALKFASYLTQEQRARIDFIEEPCLDCEQSIEFSTQTGIALAWDESLRDGSVVWDAPNLAAVVIKPTLTGSLAQVQALVAKAHQLGKQAVISSSFESSVGLCQLARLAAWLTPDVTPGLDTLSLFAAQLESEWPASKLPIQKLSDCEKIWHSA
ncbi:MAG: o-succinylbenzoate synthase [Vibrionaceae bacterium]